MAAKLYYLPIKIQFDDFDEQNELALVEEDDIEKEYREYYKWEEQFYLENGYYPHNAPYCDEDESNSL